jgi:hypothetical protein
MRWLGIVALCAAGSTGCNEAFGLHKTELRDAAYFDAPIDAPYACPQMPGVAPRFSDQFHQIIRQDCQSYSLSPATNTALALCGQPRKPFAGLIDAPMVPAMGFMPLATTFVGLDLAPEGDIAIVRQNDAPTQTVRLSVYRYAAGTWNVDVDIGTALNQNDTAGTPSRGPQRHLLIAEHEDFYIHELVEMSPGVWTEIGSTSYTALGLVYAYHPSLSPDGLRMTLYGARPSGTSSVENGVMYADRASIDDAFGQPVLLQGPPIVLDPFMTDDCARLYFNGLQSIFYVQQL